MEKDRHGGLVWKSTEFQIGGKCRQRKWWKADGVMQALYKYSKTENDRDSFRLNPKFNWLVLSFDF